MPGGRGPPLLRVLLAAGQGQGLGVAGDHGEKGVLVAGMEADPQAEAVGQRDLLLDRLAGMNRGRALVGSAGADPTRTRGPELRR